MTTQPATATAPHWLDAAFRDGRDTLETVMERLTELSAFKVAVEKAQIAYREQEQRFKDTPSLMDASPAARAREAFLAAITHGTHLNPYRSQSAFMLPKG